MPICMKEGLGYRTTEIAGDPTILNLLRQEHRLVDRFLLALYKFSKQFQKERDLGTESFNRFVDKAVQFLAVELAGMHQEKEETLLAALKEEGLVPTDGVLDFIPREHANKRRFVRVLLKAVTRYTRHGGKFAIIHLVVNAAHYGRQLSDHMCKEEATLFPVARELSAGAQQELVMQFQAIDLKACRIAPGDMPDVLRQMERERRRTMRC